MAIETLLRKINQQLVATQAERAALGPEFAAAVELGDLPENSIYDDVKFRSQVLDYKIVELKTLLKQLEVQTTKVFVLTNHTSGTSSRMAIIDGHTDEVDGIRFISSSAPLAKQIRSHAPKQTFEVTNPSGTQIYSWELD